MRPVIAVIVAALCSTASFVLAATPQFISQGTAPQGRTSSHYVGAVMALLATFDDAGILPPEGTPQANGIIKAVIQFQSAFLKSRHPAVRQFFTEAHQAKFGDKAAELEAAFQRGGWNAETFEAFIEAGLARPDWTSTGIEEGFKEFNIGRSDFDILADLYRKTTTAFSGRGKSLSEVYAMRRREMPGAQ